MTWLDTEQKSIVTSPFDVSERLDGDETIGWIVMVCGLMGSLIALLARMGGAAAFGQLIAQRVKGRTGALMTTWLLGLSIFIDDYLNALAISSSMRKVTDRLKVSREMLAYVVDSTAAPVCVLVPLSTWAVYFAAILEQQSALERGQACWSTSRRFRGCCTPGSPSRSCRSSSFEQFPLLAR